jgi:OOP family OmpA-OmpF porin
MHSLKRILSWRTVGILSIGMCLYGFVQATTPTPIVVESLFQPLGAAFNLPEKVSDTQVRLIVFRPQDALGPGGVARIKINGAYHTSLMPGAYSFLCLPPGVVRVDVRQVERHARAELQMNMDLQIQPLAGQSVYLQTSLQNNARFSLQAMEDSVAREALKASREQVHALSRVSGAEDCKDPAIAAPTPSSLPAQSPSPSR